MRLKAVVAGAVTAGLLTAMAGVALATPQPPYEPDGNARGTLVFYDASGNVITGGNIADSPMAAYVKTSGAPRAQDTVATLFAAVPEPGANSGLWATTQMSGGNSYPVAGAPGPLAGQNGVEKGAAGDATIASVQTALPHAAGDAGTAYDHLYAIRIVTSGTSSDPLYWQTDIVITGSTWHQVYPAVVTTSTLTVSPPSPQPQGTTVFLTDTVAPSTATGTVQFKSDGANLGTPQTLSGGVATASTNSLAVGTHSLIAVFSPGDPGAYAGTTTTAVPYTIQAVVANPTHVALAVDPGTSQAGTPVTFTATVSETTVAGSVVFSETPTGTVIGSSSTPGNGTYVLTSSALGQGPHSVIATFTPSDTTHWTSSTSPPVNFTLGASACATLCPDVQSIVGTIPAGTLNITTPYTPGNPLNLGTLALTSSSPLYFTAAATFTNIAITDTRSGNQSITAKAMSSNMTSGANSIDSQNLGLTNLVVQPGSTVVGPTATFNNPAATPPVAPGTPGVLGLGGGTAHTIATSTGSGSFTMNGTLTLNAPSSTPAGTYTGTITFTVG
jgi:hypothetical protein